MTTDSDTILKAQKQMQRCAKEIEAMANDMADAMTVREFNSDRLKRAFSASVVEFLDAGDSGVAAEHKSRASKTYGAHLADLQEQYKAAMRVIETYQGKQVMFSSAQSILAVERQKLGL